MRSVLALDPGVTTGYVIEYPSRLDHGQCKPDVIWDLLTECYHPNISPLTIIMERFDYRRYRTHVDLTPVEVIGVVKEFVRQRPDIDLVLQSPSQAKSYWTDDRLKQLDLWFKGEQHARDAMRHLLYWRYFGAGREPGVKVPC